MEEVTDIMKHPVWFVGNAHIDPVWLWNWQEGFSEIKATFRSALDRMKEFDDFVFTAAGASYYQWLEQNEPEMLDEIRQRVAEGRWVIAGGWWVQPDCNMPCGESFARHSLYSQALYRRLFGVQARFGYNVDSFGHNGNLPQIYTLSEMPCYVMMRPGEHEKALGVDAFNWQGVDGTVIPTYRIPFGYGTGWDTDLTDEKDVLGARTAAARPCARSARSRAFRRKTPACASAAPPISSIISATGIRCTSRSRATFSTTRSAATRPAATSSATTAAPRTGSWRRRSSARPPRRSSA